MYNEKLLCILTTKNLLSSSPILIELICSYNYKDLKQIVTYVINLIPYQINGTVTE